jgi:hypothetical protein
LEKEIKLQTIVKSLSNRYMSVIVLRLEDENIIKEYGGNSCLIRAYHERVKFFEMPLSK